MLQGLEAALGPANSGKGPALPDWSRASVHSAYRLCIACAQMAGDLSTTLQVRGWGAAYAGPRAVQWCSMGRNLSRTVEHYVSQHDLWHRSQ